MSDKYVGASTQFLHYWDEVYGWIHYTETEKLAEARERFNNIRPTITKEETE